MTELMEDPNSLELLMGIIFKDPEGCFGDFVLYRTRLQWILDEKAISKRPALLLAALLEFENQKKRLPTKTELLDAYKGNDDVLVQIVGIGDVDSEFNLDYAAQKLIEHAQYVDEKRTANKYMKTLETEPGTGKGQAVYNKVRMEIRGRWGRSLTTNVRSVEGTVQENADSVHDRIVNMSAGGEDGTGNPLSFLTGFPTIDDVILSDQERCYGVIGPQHNFKTTLTLGQAYTLAQQGKSVLYVTGEHDAEKLEEYLMLMHAYHVRHLLSRPIPPYHVWSPKPGEKSKITEEDKKNLRIVCDDLRSLRTCPGPLEIKHINQFNNSFENIAEYMENNHAKRQYKVLIIDPFDSLTLSVGAEQQFFEGNKICEKLFDLKTSFHNGEGLIIFSTFQLKKEYGPKIAELQTGVKKDGKVMVPVTDDDFVKILQDGNVETYSGAAKKFDMLWGVCSRNQKMSEGIITCARTRYSQKFKPVRFTLDYQSHFPHEIPEFVEQQLPDMVD